MLEVQAIDREQIKRHHQDHIAEAEMEFENPDGAADRLEAALERIARSAVVSPPPVNQPIEAWDANMSIGEIAERLDSLISRLRAALGEAAKSE